MSSFTMFVLLAMALLCTEGVIIWAEDCDEDDCSVARFLRDHNARVFLPVLFVAALILIGLLRDAH